MKTVIKRCPLCPSIHSYTDEVVAALERDMDVKAEVEDGDEGEFTVYVDETPLLQRGRGTMPNLDELETAVGSAM